MKYQDLTKKIIDKWPAKNKSVKIFTLTDRNTALTSW